MTARRNDTNNDEVTEEAEGQGATMTPKELAAAFSTDPKTIRKFLRSLSADRPGKGGRWVIQRSDLEALQVRFAAWNTRSATTLVLTDED